MDDKTAQIKDPAALPKNLVFECGTHNLLDIFVIRERKQTVKSKFTLKLMCLYVCMDPKECRGITFRLTVHNIFDEYVRGDQTSKYDRHKAAIHSINANDHLDKLARIQSILADLKYHLIHQQEEYLKPMQKKANSLKTILNVFHSLRQGAPISGNIVANKITFQPSTGNTLTKIILNSQGASAKNVSTLYQQLSLLNANVKVLDKSRHKTKRSPISSEKWSGDDLHVNKLYLNGDYHQFKGNI